MAAVGVEAFTGIGGVSVNDEQKKELNADLLTWDECEDIYDALGGDISMHEEFNPDEERGELQRVKIGTSGRGLLKLMNELARWRAGAKTEEEKGEKGS